LIGMLRIAHSFGARHAVGSGLKGSKGITFESSCSRWRDNGKQEEKW